MADHCSELSDEFLSTSKIYSSQITLLSDRIIKLENMLRKQIFQNCQSKRLQTMPGVGPMTAVAILAFAPPTENFSKGRDFVAWLGLVPRQYSSGGKDRLGLISKMGQADIRRLLVVGAMSVVNWATKSGSQDTWLMRLIENNPKKDCCSCFG